MMVPIDFEGKWRIWIVQFAILSQTSSDFTYKFSTEIEAVVNILFKIIFYELNEYFYRDISSVQLLKFRYLSLIQFDICNLGLSIVSIISMGVIDRKPSMMVSYHRYYLVPYHYFDEISKYGNTDVSRYKKVKCVRGGNWKRTKKVTQQKQLKIVAFDCSQRLIREYWILYYCKFSFWYILHMNLEKSKTNCFNNSSIISMV